MKKITIYAIHSSKLNYKEEFYKPLLLSDAAKHNLILPLTDKYKEKYAKDLINNAELIVINLTESSLSVYIETLWALKSKKKILFLLKDQEKNFFLLNKYKKQAETYINIEQEKDIINNYLSENIDELAANNDDGTINLGSLN